MDCKKLKTHLSAYIDGELDEKTQQQVAGHLEQCPRCRAEAEALKAMIGRLNEMPSVEAPADFAERVHARLKLEPKWKRLINRFFKPYHVKIPLELATAMAVGILVFFVMVPVYQEHQLLPGNQLATKSRPSSVDGRAQKSLEAEQFMHDASAPDKNQLGEAEESAEKTITIAWLARPKPTAPVFESQRAKGFSAAQDEAVRAKAEREQLGSKEKAPAEVRDSGKPAPPAPLSAAAPGLKTQAIDQIQDVLKMINGKVLSIETDPSGAPKAVSVEIKSRFYEAFIRQLSKTGEFKTPPPEFPPKTDQPLRLIINLPESR